MSTVRSPAVAGTFYPADPAALERAVDDCLDRARVEPLPAKAIVAPHAGYVYSGPIAGTAYAAVLHRADRVRRVVLAGPAHRYPLRGIAVPGADGLATPLGVVPVDRAALDAIADLPGVQTLDRAFDGEHSLEVHLPFLQRVFPDAAVVPLLVGETPADMTERVLERLWGGPETLVVVSSDLSHFHDSDTARTLDRATSDAIEAAAPERLSGDRACGVMPLAGLLRRARALDLRVTTRDLRNSGDTAGGRDRVVGYGAYSLEPAEEARLTDDQRRLLLDAAMAALRHRVERGVTVEPEADAFPLPLRAARRTFVTLDLDGSLRGCIGTLEPVDPLVRDVAANAVKAAMQDPRFAPLSAAELARVSLTVSILSHDRPIAFTGEADLLAQLRPGRDGLIIADGTRRALFLPKVWDVLPDPRDFLHHLKAKAGLAPDRETGTLRALRFTAETFGTA
ncbi:AmmeMemoRadiSam system protein B [Azospirillum halopraeferens]|uniref:AmmeMemoRadiSam system protein B n=1 Tax=Azospirillum halopraeferens TaxID=34010 RepID=UPI00041C51B7|nr:AmmeMemoRadiSam system protein B [Azospirillum halopraeferens]